MTSLGSSNPTSSSSSSNSSTTNGTLNNNQIAGQASGQTSTAFYRLKVEDALSYLDKVKLQFEKQPEVYNQFLDIMKEFKSQAIDTPGVINRVSTLFKGHNDLIEGFNTFLPPGYKIEIQANDSVHYTAPNSSMSTLVNQNTSIKPRTVQQAISSQAIVPTTLVANPIGTTLSITSGIGQNLIKNEAQKLEPIVLATIPNNTGIKNIPQPLKLASASSAPSLVPIQSTPSNTAILTVSTPPPPPSSASSTSSITTASTTSLTSNTIVHQINNQSVQPAPTQPPPSNQNQVEFGHAINYVNKIKSRFSNQPDIYKSFLEILHTYQKQQRNLKDGIVPANFLTEQEVYAKVANLFKNQEDLLVEFSQFLPDANGSSLSNSNNLQINQVTLQQQQQSLAQNVQSIQSNSMMNEYAGQLAGINLSSQQLAPLIQSTMMPLPTVLQSNTQTIKSASLTQAQPVQPIVPQPNNNIPKPGKAEQTQPTPTKTEPQRPQTPADNASVSSVSSIQSSISQKASNVVNNGPVKRASSTQPISAKKQKIGTTALGQSQKLNTISQINQQQQQQQQNQPKLSPTSTNPPIQPININKNLNITKYNQNQTSLDYIRYAPMNETTFFEKLKKALRTQQVYDNFLKCLALFNQDIITRNELIKLAEPFLSKFSNLYRWFKDYVENTPFNSTALNTDSFFITHPDSESSKLNSNKQNLLNGKDKINLPTNNIHLEIDYLACKQYGASYRDISSYPQPISSGQTELCKQVLNSTYVSFPSWSEDSTFISSKKNQYEEQLFRIEDERFELDVVLETNLSTIKVMENLVSKMSRMKSDEIAKFKLDNFLGGESEIIHMKAVQRIYADKSKDFIEGLKQNPQVAVPLVLKRLKAKDEEWREAKKNLEKTWREQAEKNYLKSLDHCSVPFKQSDQKYLKTKSLLNEIENIYYERNEVKEQTNAALNALNSIVTNEGNLSNSNKNLLSHSEPHLSFKYEDKSILEDAAALIIHHVKRQTAIQKEDKHKIKQIVYYFMPDLFFVSRGALSDDESSETQNSNYKDNQMDIGVDDNSNKKLRSNNSTQSGLNTTPTRHTDTNKRRLTDSEFDKIKDLPNEYKSPEDMYRLLYVDEHWYLFFRYHQILCERLFKIYKHSQHLAEQELIDAKYRDQSVAEMLKLRNKLEVSVDEYYPAFLDIVRNLLDGNMDSSQYEDTLREMFGTHAYIAFTLDKVVHNCVRQLQFLVQDETSITVKQIYKDEQKNSHTTSGSKVSHMSYSNVMTNELNYQKKIENLLNEQNVYKILTYKNSCRLTVELLDPQRGDDEEDDMNDEVDIPKWSEYIEKYCSGKEISDEVKSRLLTRPIFLTRNAHSLKVKHDIYKNEDCLKINDKELERYDLKETRVNYRKNSFKNAKKSHLTVSKKMYEKFRKNTNKWLKEHAVSTDCIDDWLMGEHLENSKTICLKETSHKKVPYHVFYRYKVEVNESSKTTD
ncbi:unnamed protein product [Brachionus calyciflorus]|uniref:Paired amphipathic helix protein Sin3b n=1 Tax=Brachionus calyciflorus TaxID=104777 RepID=A0A813QRC7_9BILA|nr:unnamed protein product [Brachionus calyciflorus]